MMRFLYIWLLRVHPQRFRQRFGDEMLSIFDQSGRITTQISLIGDGLISLFRQWMLRPEFHTERAASFVPDPDGVPAFYLIETSLQPGVLRNGSIVTFALFAALGYVIGRGGAPRSVQLDVAGYRFLSDSSLLNKRHPEAAGQGFWSNLLAFFPAPLLSKLRPAMTEPDFTGEWRLIVAKSDFGRMTAPLSAVMKIEHKDPRLRVLRTMNTGDGERTTDTVYSTDGKISGNSDGKSTTKWVGPTLLIESKTFLNGNEFRVKWSWTLSNDGKTLITVRTFSRGEASQTEIYEKVASSDPGRN
jgi:hypothetical protein